MKRSKLKALFISFFCLLLPLTISAAEKNYHITENLFSTQKALFTFQPSAEFLNNGLTEQTLNFILPTDKFSCIVKNSGKNKNIFSFNSQYIGKIHGYHVTQVKISYHGNTTQNNRKISAEPLEISFSFNSATKNFRRDLPAKDNYLANLVENYQSGRSFRQVNNEADFPKTGVPKNQRSFKIYVKEDGIYKLDSYELARNGIDLSGVDPRTIRLFNEGKEIPVFVFGEGDHVFDNYDYIEFYGEKNLYRYRDLKPDRYLDTESDENIYHLTFGGEFGKRLVEESGAIVEDDPAKMFQPEFFINKLHFEQENVRYQQRFLPDLNDPDLWFYTYVDGLFNKDLPFTIRNIKNDSVKVEYSLISSPPGDTSDLTNNLNLSLNSINLPTVSWQGLYPYAGSAKTASTSALLEGNNILNISNINARDQRVYLNWFAITYSSLFKADNNYLLFNQGGKYVAQNFYSPTGKLFDYKVTGFTTDKLQIYKLGVSKIVNPVVQSVENNGNLTYNLHFQDQVASPVRYLVITEEQKKLPVKIEEMRTFNTKLTDPANHAAYLIITHKDFLENATLTEYLEHKAAQFGADNIKVVEIEQIFDEFSNSEFSSNGLYNFLRFVVNNWSEVPEFVNLIGTASYNHKSNPDDDFVPLKTFQHYQHGAVVSDYLLSVHDDSGSATYTPQFYIGRIPCACNTQLSDYLEKVLKYEKPVESALGVNYQKRLRSLDIISDPDVYPGFLTTTLPYKSKFEFPDRMLIWSNEEPYQGGTASLLEKFDRGVGQVNYFGHGSGEIWANSQLLLPQDVERLAANTTYPVIYTWSCYGGNFPTRPSDNYSDLGLSEKLLFADKKGGVAIISASANSQFSTNFKIYAEVLKKQKAKSATLGELFTQAKYQFYLNYINMDDNQGKLNLYQYILLGDPTLKLDYPEEKGDLTINSTQINYQSPLKIGGLNNLPSGQGLLKLYNSGSHYVPLTREEEQVNFSEINNGEITIQLPDSAACHFPDNPDNYLTARLFWSSANNDYSIDYNIIFLQNSNIPLRVVKKQTLPENLVLTDLDSIAFQAEIFSSKAIQSVKCFIDTTQYESKGFDIVFDQFKKIGATYTSLAKIAPLRRNSKVSYYFQVIDADSNIVVSDTAKITVPIADLYHFEFKPAYQDSSLNRLSALVNMRFAVPSFARIKYSNIKVNFWNDDNPSAPVLLGTAQLDMEIDETKTAVSKTCWIEHNFQPGLHNYRISINPGLVIPELLSGMPPDFNNEINGYIKTNRFAVSAANGTEINGQHAVVAVDNLSCEIPAQAVSQNAVLELDTISINSLPFQQDYQPLWYSNGQKTGLNFRLYNSGNGLAGKTAKISLKNINLENYSAVSHKLCYYDPAGKKWRVVAAQFTTAKSTVTKSDLVSRVRVLYNIDFETTRSGIYSILKCTDKIIPTVEINAEGQVFNDNSFVSSAPKMIIIAQDLSGINPASLLIKLDGRTLLNNEIQITDLNEVNNSIQASLTPSVAPGSHIIEVKVADNAGNETSFSRRFSVADKFEVVYHGNYPNPFINETVFSYKLTQSARTVNLAIYTVSGRKIRNFRQENVINYAEIRWDGRDEDGELIANGVYFYKLTVDNGSKKTEVTGKMARLRK